MITLRLDLEDPAGEISQLVATEITPYGDARCSCLVLNDQFKRPIYYENIAQASDASTGEVICVRTLCGARPAPDPIASQPQRQERPTGRKKGKASELFPGQRRQDRADFFRRYRVEIIWNHYRNKLISSFGGRCFACSNPNDLQMDHHVPLALGGKREPGNIVMLCAKCNQMKWDYPPDIFYSPDEICFLESLLPQQSELLEFTFDGDRWHDNPISYLGQLGISPLLLHEVSTNSNHEWHVPELAA